MRKKSPSETAMILPGLLAPTMIPGSGLWPSMPKYRSKEAFSMDRPRMMPLITRPLPSVSRDADAVVLNGQLNFFSRGSGGKGDDRFRCLVTGGILEELAQDKGSPFFVGIDKVVQILHFNPDTALEQQGAVIFDGLGISLKSVTGKRQVSFFFQ